MASLSAHLESISTLVIPLQWIATVGKDSLEILTSGLEAAAILLFIVTSPGIDRRVVNEDAIAASIVLMKHNLIHNIIPAINATGHIVASLKENKQTATTKKRRRSTNAGVSGAEVVVVREMKKSYRLIMQTITGTVFLMERMTLLIQRVPLDDQHLITCSAGALATLELDPSIDSYKIQVATIALVTSIFRQYHKMRESIIQDLFPLMLLMPTGKKTLRSFSIQFSSVLFPENVQKLSRSLLMDDVSNGSSVVTSSRANIQPMTVLILNLVQAAVLRPSYEEVETEEGNADDDDNNAERQLNAGLSRCQYVSSIFVRHLMHRCAQKGEDGGASDFRPILSNLIDDLLLVVLGPEYPAAEMILLDIVNDISRTINTVVERKSIRRGVEETYLNTIFDALGKICAAEAKIRCWNKSHPILDLPSLPKNNPIKRFDCYCGREENSDRYMLNCDRCKTWCHGDCVGISRENQPDKWLCDGCQLGAIADFEREYNSSMGDLGCPPELIDRSYCIRRLLVDHLSLLLESTGQTGIKDAYKFHLARWLNNLGLQASNKARSDARKGRVGDTTLASVLLDMWDPSETQHEGAGSLSGMLHCISDEGRGRMMVDLITNLSGLLSSFQSQVGFVLKLLEDNNTRIRKLSLKAIEKIADSDPSLMLKSKFQKAVFHRFSDDAVSVREAVVSLVGNYVIQSPELANAFHRAFVVGLADPGLSVKKRTVNVLHSVLCNNPRYTGRAEACSIMLRLVADPKEDDTIRDLIHDLFAKIWLENGEEAVQESRIVSPQTSAIDFSDTPASRVLNMEYVGRTSATPGDATIMTAGTGRLSSTPNAWSTLSRNNRSTARRTRNRYLRVRCEVAAEQMVDVVREANSGEGLTLLFRELTSDVLDSDKTKKASARKKRQGLARDQSAMLIDALFDLLLAVEDDPSISKIDRGKDFVAVFRVIRVFADVSPLGIVKHLDTLLPYLKLDNGVESWHEEEIASSLCPIFSRVIPELDQQTLLKLAEESIADDLVKITMARGRSATSSAVEALCLLADHKSTTNAKAFQEKLLHLARAFYSYLEKHKKADSVERPLTGKAKTNIKRALGVMGSICRFFESSSFDSMESSSDLNLANVAPLCEKMFMHFFGKDDEEIIQGALRAMVGIFHAHPKEMLRMEQNGLIDQVMAPSSPELVQLESLHCWRDILLAEEERIESGVAKAKMDSKKGITVSKKISGDQDSDAILCGGILTRHAKRIFKMTASREESIRFAAVDLTGHLLRQGQLNPHDAVPHMLAVQGDIEERIRRRALQILMVEGQKRAEIVRQRLYAGIKRSYLFQKAVYPDLDDVTALITVKKEGVEEKECVFGSVYKECIANNKKQRRSLLQNLVHVFDLSNISDSSKSKKVENSWLADLELLSYTSQVLAYLPYVYPSDVLFVIYRSDAIITRNGNDLLEKITAFLRDCGLSNDDGLGAGSGEDDIISLAAKRHVPHHSKEATALLDSSFDVITFAKLCNEAGCIILLLRLKSFFQQLYGLSESRCHQFDPNKTLVEKAMAKSATSSVFPSKLPMQGKKLKDNTEVLDAAILQCEEFRRLMRMEHKQVAIVMEEAATTADGDADHAEDRPSEDEDMLDEPTAVTTKRRKS